MEALYGSTGSGADDILEKMSFIHIDSNMVPYISPEEYEQYQERYVKSGQKVWSTTDAWKQRYTFSGVNRRQQKALPKSKPYHYRSTDGIDIYVGKNAAQNDRLTGDARPNETWLHAKDMPGSHVIIREEGEIPRQTLLEAAILAAWYSKGQNSSGVPIDYTLRRYVKKPGGAAPGMVIYTNQRTLFMTVSESDVRKIQLVEE